ncbi:MAG: T9SS type A sorting domain-containing protein [Ignavibacteriaceae bacterium]|nr:T9SS type A sorting domain-containing protein [Ignavibacteriaceae bacterium]
MTTNMAGPYKDFNRITGEMLLWGLQDSAKAWWQMEQAVVAGLQMYNQTGENWYLQMADETINFFMQFFVDHQNGEVYENRKRRGGFAWNEAKGNSGKAGYHSIETGYYTYLYGKLLYHFQPSILHYKFYSLTTDRDINLTPIAINNDALKISEILLDGQVYTDYDPVNRVLHLPSGFGGNFIVRYEPISTDINPDELVTVDGFELMQNYPNPFNPGTTIKYQLPDAVNVSLKIFNSLGEEVATLIDDEFQNTGSHSKLFIVNSTLPSGVYFYRLQAGNYIDTKKMILLK